MMENSNKVVVCFELALIILTTNCSLACYALACEDQTGSGTNICGTTGKQELILLLLVSQGGVDLKQNKKMPPVLSVTLVGINICTGGDSNP